jgi:hypothetical protein
LTAYFSSPPSFAAEKIVVRYGILEQSLPVIDLQNYAQNKVVSSALRDFLRFLMLKNKTKYMKLCKLSYFWILWL